MTSQNTTSEMILKGVALSEGIVLGRVCLFNENRHSNLPIYKVEGSGVEKEHRRVDRALKVTTERLEEIRADVEKTLGKAESEIFNAQKMILADQSVVKKIHDLIDRENVNAETAISRAFDYFENAIRKLSQEHFKERASDIAELKGRLLDFLGNMKPSLQCAGLEHCQKGKHRIVVADELTPSMTVELDISDVKGFVTEKGGKNSHGAILARSLGVPAVSGLSGLREIIGCGTELIVDGYKGEVIVWPSEDRKKNVQDILLRKKKHKHTEMVAPIEGFSVMANINSFADVAEALEMQAEGIGLYRTEMDLIANSRLLSEDELYEKYTAVLKAMEGEIVFFRLFDIGSDKVLPFLEIQKEQNPALGWRGLRLLLGKKDLFATQARALARASVNSPVWVLYPMVVDLEQFLAARRFFMEQIADLKIGEIKHGVLFEVPSACLAADELMKYADFASIGTNDLIQYMFAVDRDNELVAYDYHVERPVFWELMANLVQVAKHRGKMISVCGEMAGDVEQIGKLYDIGIRRVSVSARRIPEIRRIGAKKIKGGK